VLKSAAEHVLRVRQVVARDLIERGCGGAIVNMSSIASTRTTANCSLYGMTKAAVDNLTRSMALELGPHQVSALCHFTVSKRWHNKNIYCSKWYFLSSVQSHEFRQKFLLIIVTLCLLLKDILSLRTDKYVTIFTRDNYAKRVLAVVKAYVCPSVCYTLQLYQSGES